MTTIRSNFESACHTAIFSDNPYLKNKAYSSIATAFKFYIENRNTFCMLSSFFDLVEYSISNHDDNGVSGNDSKIFSMIFNTIRKDNKKYKDNIICVKNCIKNDAFKHAIKSICENDMQNKCERYFYNILKIKIVEL